MNFILQPNSLFARHYGCNTKPLQKELDHHLDMENPDCNWDDLFRVKSTSNFLREAYDQALLLSVSRLWQGRRGGRDGGDLDLDDQMLCFTCSE